MKLYELSQNYKNLQELLDNEDIPQELITNALNEVEGQIEEKAENIAKLMKNLDADAKALKEEEKRLSDKRKAIENRVSAVKSYLYENMKVTGKTKFKTSLFSFSIAKNGGKAPLDVYGKVPVEFCDLVPNNEKIRQALEEGQELDFAILQERGESLRIR
ncbi:siphovirus Gp157 family protein [Clostridium polynesiense]|uniref:siphovirus Gp157 family protein n=1 Tax=Clostridium polynesiense TaxID=1325933 RepID=UPI00058B3C54|nr:siphovirus Gp157 family protein [Clostridium polynesiense]